MDIFDEVKQIVRANPNEFKSTIDGITKQLSNVKTEAKLMDRMWDCWRDSTGNDLIVLAWLLSDSAIGHGEPELDKRIVKMLLDRPEDEGGKHVDGKNVNPWNIVQDWTKAVIFYQEDSKTRLADAVRAYGGNTQPEEGFSFVESKGEPTEVFFEGERLPVPSGRPLEILYALVQRMPKSASYEDLNGKGLTGGASEQLRNEKSRLDCIIKQHTPFEIKTTTRYGYRLAPKQ